MDKAQNQHTHMNPFTPTHLMRIQYIDIAKCLCIFLIVLWHYSTGLDINFWGSPYLIIFELPMFYFISGLFFKPQDSCSEFIKKKANSILIPFAFFYLSVTFFLANISLIKHGGIGAFQLDLLWAFLEEKPMWNIPLWFLWSLFVVNVYFYLICALAQQTNKQTKRK